MKSLNHEHHSNDEFQKYFSGELQPSERLEIARDVKSCTTCQERWANKGLVK